MAAEETEAYAEVEEDEEAPVEVRPVALSEDRVRNRSQLETGISFENI